MGRLKSDLDISKHFHEKYLDKQPAEFWDKVKANNILSKIPEIQKKRSALELTNKYKQFFANLPKKNSEVPGKLFVGQKLWYRELVDWSSGKKWEVYPITITAIEGIKVSYSFVYPYSGKKHSSYFNMSNFTLRTRPCKEIGFTLSKVGRDTDAWLLYNEPKEKNDDPFII